MNNKERDIVVIASILIAFMLVGMLRKSYVDKPVEANNGEIETLNKSVEEDYDGIEVVDTLTECVDSAAVIDDVDSLEIPANTPDKEKY